MLPCSSQQSIISPKVKVTPEKVGEKLKLLRMDFFNFDKYRANRNMKIGSKITTASVWKVYVSLTCIPCRVCWGFLQKLLNF